MTYLQHRHRSAGAAAGPASTDHEHLERLEQRLAAAAAVLRDHRRERPAPGVHSALERFETQLRHVRQHLGARHH